MRLIAIIKKEIMAIKSQKISLVLILLYPILGTLLLGLAMTGAEFDAGTNINIGLLDNNSPLISELSNNSANYTFITYFDKYDLKEAVSKKQVTVGLEFIEDDKEQTKVNIYYDNSSLTSSSIFTSMVKTNIENIAKEQTLGAISEILKTTKLLSTNVTEELEKLGEFKDNLKSTDIMLDGLEIKINSFDINDLQDDINEQKTNIEIFKEKSDRLKEALVLARIEFENIKLVTTEIDSNLNYYSNELNSLGNEIINQEQSLNEIIDQLNNLYSSIPGSIKNEYSDQVDQLGVLLNYLSSWKTTVLEVNDSVDEAIASQTTLTSSLNEFDLILLDLEKESKEIDDALNSSEQGIENLESKLELFQETITQARELINESRKSKEDIQAKLDQSEILFKELLPKIDSFKDINPELLIQPINIKLIPTEINSKLTWHIINMDATQIGVMVANSISIILILTCILLSGIVILTEKNQDIPLRTFMSDTPPVVLTIGKLIGQVLIALVETIMILFVAIGVFGFPLSINYFGLFLSVLLISMAFVSIGMIIGAYTKNQSTTILLSLLLIVPMLFISGIIVPLDLMPGFMGFIANLMPLTAANNLLIGVIVKSGDLYFILKEVIVLSVITIIGIVLFTLKKD